MVGEGLNRVIAGAATIVLWLGQEGVRASTLWRGSDDASQTYPCQTYFRGAKSDQRGKPPLDSPRVQRNRVQRNRVQSTKSYKDGSTTTRKPMFLPRSPGPLQKRKAHRTCLRKPKNAPPRSTRRLSRDA
jgi:hypothetical protein